MAHKPKLSAVIDALDEESRDIRGIEYRDFLKTLIADLEIRLEAVEQEIEEA